MPHRRSCNVQISEEHPAGCMMAVTPDLMGGEERADVPADQTF